MSTTIKRQSPSSDFFKQVSEVDKGQPTDNVHIIATRFIDSGEKPNSDIINEVLRLESDSKINDNMVDTFQKLYDNRTEFGQLPIDRAGMVSFRNLEKSGKPAGVYVFQHKVTGEQYVGSSTNLIERVRFHYYGKTHGRLAQHLKVNGIGNYTVSVTVLPDHLVSKNNILALEQYLIFLLNPSVNFLKVANSSHKTYSEEAVAKMRTIMGNKVYVYYLGVLVYVFDSVRQCFQELNEANNFAERVFKRMKGVYRQDLLFSKTPIAQAKVSLMDLAEFKQLFETVKKADKRTPAMPSNAPAVISTFEGVKVGHRSLVDLSSWLKEKGILCSRQRLFQMLDTGYSIGGYTFERPRSGQTHHIITQSKVK